jgi:nicotinamidase-related amidase
MEHEALLHDESTALVVVDIQEKLLPHVLNNQEIIKNAVKVIEFCKILEIPIIVTEQYPKGLGVTVPEIQKALGEEYRPIEKTAFSCFGEEMFVETLDEMEVDTLVLMGIETHICVAQTALVGLDTHDIHALADCMGSRIALDHELALNRLRDEGVVVSTVETFMYETLKEAKTADHKAVFHLLK